jgi:glutamate racemase
MNPSAPIGVFDSGVGGLSVLREIRAALLAEDLLYVADSGHVPYGNKSQSYIQERSKTLARFLLQRGAKAIVVACNTATASAVGVLRGTFAMPIIAMEPAVKPAVAATRSGVVGVLATVGTLRSARFAALLERWGHGVEIVTQPCPGLVEQVEAGDLHGPTTQALVERYTAPLLAKGADTIVLGCTHYPFLRPLIADVLGPDIALIDTGAAVARQLQRVLEAHNLLNQRSLPGSELFWTSGDANDAARVISCLWGGATAVQRLPDRFQNLRS